MVLHQTNRGRVAPRRVSAALWAQSWSRAVAGDPGPAAGDRRQAGQRGRAAPAPEQFTVDGGGPAIFQVCVSGLTILWSNIQHVKQMQTSLPRANGAGSCTEGGVEAKPSALGVQPPLEGEDSLGGSLTAPDWDPFFCPWRKRLSLRFHSGSMALSVHAVSLGCWLSCFTATIPLKVPGSSSNSSWLSHRSLQLHVVNCTHWLLSSLPATSSVSRM